MQFLLFLFFYISVSSMLHGEVSTEDSRSKYSEELQQLEKERQSPQEKKIEPLKIGNFALSTSQEPGPLVSFGQNIIDKGQTQLFVYADDFHSKKRITTDIIPSVLYGITDDFSVFFNAPLTPLMKDTSSDSPSQQTSSPSQGRSTTTSSKNSKSQAATQPSSQSAKAADPSSKSKTHRSRGWEDLLLQLEYAVSTKTTLTSTGQATIVANMTFPTGSNHKNPPTGFGAPSYFVGGTYNYMTTYWFAFTSAGVVFPTSHRGTRFGEHFLYQVGVGGNIPSPKNWIYAWMVEMDGEYDRKDRIKRVIDPNSGGNTIFLTPSLWISSERIIIQFGVGVPTAQHLYGEQNKFHYSLICNLGYTF